MVGTKRLGVGDWKRKWMIVSLTLFIVLFTLPYFGFLQLYDLDPHQNGGAGNMISKWTIASSQTNKFRPEFLSTDNTFPGAREWYDYWTYASRKIVKEEELHIHDDYIVSAVDRETPAALQHIKEMQQRYENVSALADFYARGLGWVYTRLNMVFTVVVAGNFTSGVDHSVMKNSGLVTIFIVDTIGEYSCNGEGNTWIDKQPPLTMWVRAYGKSTTTNGEGEIFAGTALLHKLKGGKCTWRYDFVPKSVGEYSIHVKVLNYNGFYDSLNETCVTENLPSRNELFDKQDKTEGEDLIKTEAFNNQSVTDLAAEGNYTHHRGIRGFKMYQPKDACCEACRRAHGCKMYTIPGALHYDECELFFDKVEDDIDFFNGQYLGRDRNYSYTAQDPNDFPSTRRRRLAISSDELAKIWPLKAPPLKGYPPATKTDTYFIGCGWSSLLSFESPCHYPSDDLVFGSGKNKIQIVSTREDTDSVTSSELYSFNTSRPCILDDEKLDISYGKWIRLPFPDNELCLPMERDTNSANFKNYRPKYNHDRPSPCWHRDDITQISNTCAEGGCSYVLKHRWYTELKQEAQWYGMWQQQDCQYYDMGDDEIQTCVERRNISSIQVRGASIKSIVEGYLSQKLENINMTNATHKTVILDTLKMPHVLWGKSLAEFQTDLENYPNVSYEQTGIDEHYWISGFFYTSEREPHVQVDRSLQFSKVAYEVLSKKGYKMINGLDVTASFAYDTDGQADGMHICGPPIRAIVTKFLHHLCQDVL